MLDYVQFVFCSFNSSIPFFRRLQVKQFISNLHFFVCLFSALTLNYAQQNTVTDAEQNKEAEKCFQQSMEVYVITNNFKESWRLIKQACELDPENPIYITHKARMLWSGKGVKQDKEAGAALVAEQIPLLKSMASNNAKDTLANYFLGFAFENGLGVTKDAKKAVEFYTQSADNGYALAKMNLGNCYVHGNGVQQDYQKAKLLLEEAAGDGIDMANVNLAYMHLLGQGVEKDNYKAVRLYLKAAEAGIPHAMQQAGIMLLAAKDIPNDFELAKKWLEEAEKYDLAPAIFHLGRMHMFKLGVPLNPQLAYNKFKKASALGYAEASNQIGVILYKSSRFADAKKWYEKALKQGLRDSAFNIGIMEYKNLLGTKEHFSAAMEWFEKAGNHPQALYMLGNMYEKGTGVPPDLNKAKEYYKKSLKIGFAPAKQALLKLGEKK